MKRVYFVYENEKSDPLFQRAAIEILHLNGEIPLGSEDYIPLNEEEKFEENLKCENEEKYCLYLLYKIYHYLEMVHAVKILKMGGDFVRDETGLVWVVNISRVQFKNLTINTKEDDKPRNLEQLIKLEDEKVSHELEKHFKDLERREAVKLINNIMQQHFENMKKNIGLDVVEIYYEDDLSDDVFARIHPDAPFKLSELLKSKLTYQEIKDFIIKNASKLIKHNKYYYDGKNVKLPTKDYHQGLTSKLVPGASIRKSESSAIIRNSILSNENDNHTSLKSFKIPPINISKQGRSNSVADLRRGRIYNNGEPNYRVPTTEDISTGYINSSTILTLLEINNIKTMHSEEVLMRVIRRDYPQNEIETP